MHYRNGREAKPGDRALNLETGQTGVLYDLNGGSTTCNGRLAVPSPGDHYVTLSRCVHVDDAKSAMELAFPTPPGPS